MQTNLIDNSITLIFKLSGTSCNMVCEYCYEHTEDKKDRYVNTYNVDEVKGFLNSYIKYKHVYILFHGGEPLLTKIEDIRSILKFIKNSFLGTFNIQFQTNGTLLNDEWINLFKLYEPHISLSVSLDPVGEKDLRKAICFDYRKKVLSNLNKYKESVENIGVVSVAHKFNIGYFLPFIKELIKIGVKALTINKCQFDTVYKNDYAVSEQRYVDFLKELTKIYIREKLYEKIKIQPINSLFQNNNKICIYLPDKNKCAYFCTYFNSNRYNILCDHVADGVKPKVPKKCLSCDIYDKCGAGCLVEIKDQTFCTARHDLFKFIEEIKR